MVGFVAAISLPQSLYQSRNSKVNDITIRKKSTHTRRPAFRWIACLICSLASFTFSVAPTTVLAIRSMSVFCREI